MANFAELNENNIVERVIVINNADLLDENNVEKESLGIAFCKNLFGEDTTWVQTSYNANFRGCYAGPSYLYDHINDKFVPPIHFASWMYDYDLQTWVAPIPKPETVGLWIWDEDTLSWKE
jgi:hypothetical protein